MDYQERAEAKSATGYAIGVGVQDQYDTCEQSPDNRLAEISAQLEDLKDLTRSVASMARKHGDMLLGGRPEAANASGLLAPKAQGFVSETLEQINEIRRIVKDAHSNLSRYS